MGCRFGPKLVEVEKGGRGGCLVQPRGKMFIPFTGRCNCRALFDVFFTFSALVQGPVAVGSAGD